MTAELASSPQLRRPVVLPRPEFPVPVGQLIPLEEHQVPDYVYLDDARQYEMPARPEVIPQIIYAGVNLLAARPGAGKTVLSIQLGNCVALLEPFAGYAPEEPGRVLGIDFENGVAHATRTSQRHVPFGQARTGADGTDRARMFPWESAMPGSCFEERIADLRARLEKARDAGKPFRMVIIDAMISFCGPYPPNVSRDQWEGPCIRQLDRLALEMRCAILLIHHTNKAGQIAGSEQIQAALTTAYLINRDAGTDDGILHCAKNREITERSWPMQFVGGIWQMGEPISKAQAASTGTSRRILDWLYPNGPAKVAEIREGLAGVKEKTVSDVLYRLKMRGWVTRDADGLWAVAGPGATAPERPTHQPPLASWGPGTEGEAAQEIGACDRCHQSMRLVESGQRMHPTCAEEAAAEEAAASAAGAAAVLEDQDVGADLCRDCGEEITGADTHPYCAPEGVVPKWTEAFDLMRSTLEKSRMHPVGKILPADHPNRKEEMQHRDMPQWRAAEEADRSAEAGFRWERPGLLEEFGPDRLVVPFDRAQFFPSSCSSVPLAANLLLPTGPLDRHPRELGKTDPRTGKPQGRAGVAEIIVPQWDYPEVAHPLGKRAVPGERMWIVTGMLEDLWKLHELGFIPRPVVTDSFTGRRTVGLFDPFAEGVRKARAKYADDPEMTKAVKLYSSKVLRLLYPKEARSPWWRPEWRGGVVSQGAYRHWLAAWKATRAGEIVTALERTDAVAYLLPEGADPQTWIPSGYTLGSNPGNIHPGEIRVREDVDLTGIDPGQIKPSGHKRYLEISGPVPLRVWVNRRA